jgi:tetratricopeptide (TPR) repeat protein
VTAGARLDGIPEIVAEIAALGAAGHPEHALALASRAIAQHADIAMLWAIRGRLRRLAGDVDRAASDLDRARALSPRDPYVLAQHAWLLWVRGDRAGAKSQLRRLASAQPTYHWASAYLAQQHLVTGQLRAADRAVRRALAIAPRCSYTRRLAADLLANAGQLARARAVLDELARATSDPQVSAERGLVLAYLGDDAAALAAIDRALAEIPSRHLWRDRASIHILRGDHASALADCLAAVEVSAEDEPWLAYRMAQLSHRLGDPAATRRASRLASRLARSRPIPARLGTLASPRWTRRALLGRVGIMEPPGAPLR